VVEKARRPAMKGTREAAVRANICTWSVSCRTCFREGDRTLACCAGDLVVLGGSLSVYLEIQLQLGYGWKAWRGPEVRASHARTTVRRSPTATFSRSQGIPTERVPETLMGVQVYGRIQFGEMFGIYAYVCNPVRTYIAVHW
jgi:hypothetical protein